MRLFTINKIERWCNNEELSKLIDALNCQDPEIRKASVLCLGSMGNAVALEPLEYLANHDPDVFVRFDATKAIENIKLIGYDSRINMNPEMVQPILNLNVS